MKISSINNNLYLYKNHKLPYFTGKNLLEMSKEEIFDEVKKSINEDQFIGSGRHAKVYRITDTPYCVKIPYICEDGYKNDFSTDLKPYDKVNHIKIKLGAGASIMNYYQGETLFPLQLYDYSRHKLQKEVSQMPLKSYSDLLHQLANAIDNEMDFDKGAGNIIIDTENQELTIIDFYQIKDNPISTKPLQDIFYTLTSYGAESNTANKIANKIMQSALEEFKPNVIPCMDIELFDFKGLLDSVHYLNQNKAEKEKELLKKLEDIKEIKRKEIVDKNYSTLLDKKIKTTEKLQSEYFD